MFYKHAVRFAGIMIATLCLALPTGVSMSSQSTQPVLSTAPTMNSFLVSSQACSDYACALCQVMGPVNCATEGGVAPPLETRCVPHEDGCECVWMCVPIFPVGTTKTSA